MRAFLVLSTLMVSLGLGGCGGCNDTSGVGHLPDAPPPPDAEVDAPADLPPSPVTITVTLGGDPLAGLTVYFQESNSALVSTMRTGADGKASAVVGAGGFVTVVRLFPVIQTANELPDGPHSDLSTFAGVKPGDDLHLDLDPVPPPAGASIAFDLSVPDEGLGRTYTLYSSCGGPQTIGTGPLPVQAGPRAARASAAAATAVTGSVTLTGCGGAADMLVISTDGETQIVRSWLYKPAVAVADGVPAAVTGAYQGPTDLHFTYTSVAPTIDFLFLRSELRSGRGSLWSTERSAAERSGDTAMFTQIAPVPPGLMAVTTTQEDPNAGHGRQSFIEWGGDGDYTLDHSTATLHGYASKPSADVGSHVIQWTELSGGAAPDFVLGSYNLSRVDDNGLNTWSWQIAAPYTAGQAKLTYPVLPTTIYDYNPAADEQPFVQRLTTVKAPGGYGAFRAHAFGVIRSDVLGTEPQFGITGASGRIVFEEMFESGVEAKAATPPRALSGRPVPRKR